MSAPAGRSRAPRLLTELVEHPLDPGYAVAAARRVTHAPTPRERRLSAIAVAAGALVIGLLLVIAYQHTHRGAPKAQQVHDRLVQRVRNAERTTAGLADRATTLQTQLDAAQARALPQAGAQQLDAVQLAAGLTKVAGPGLTVTLTDPRTPTGTPTPGRAGSVPIDATTTLTDRDVRSVVNELWHDGAETIAVNGVRLTPTSAIRFAGQAVLVDLQPVTSPYRIEAIGDRDTLSVDFAQSAVAARFQTLEGVQGIGFSFADGSKLTLPAGAPGTSRFAKPATR